MRKWKYFYRTIVAALFFILIFITSPLPVRADDGLPEDLEQIVRLKKDPMGDILCFDITVAPSSAQIKYRTIGWIIKINGTGIIYKYLASEANSETFSFRLTDLEREFSRQYGENSSQYKAVIDAMYKNGGTISFDAINTVSEYGQLLGSIVDKPVYGKADSYNYIGEVYDTLEEIINARPWTDRTKEVDLPKYYGISYNFSPQPYVDGKVTIRYVDEKGAIIKSSSTIEKKIPLSGETVINFQVPDIPLYVFDCWKLIKNEAEIAADYTENIEIKLTSATPVLRLDIIYEKFIGVTDLKVIDISPSTYSASSRVLTVVRIKNLGNENFGPDNPVDVRLWIGDSQVFTRKVDIGSNKVVLVPFVWETPASGTILLRAEVNYNARHFELDYTNNYLMLQAKIREFIIPEIGDTPPVELLPPPAAENDFYREWKEWRFSHWERSLGKNIPVYEEKTFWVRLKINCRPSRTAMKSGYGFGLDAEVIVESNYDRPEFIIAPQKILVYLPETRYNAFLLLEEVERVTDFISKWHFSVNPKSVLGRPYHYVPIWFPDKVYYIMNVTAIDCFCPGGSLTVTGQPKV